MRTKREHVEKPNHSHNQTSTEVRVNASYWPFSCGFFCVRKTNNDVLDPKEHQKDNETPSPK